MSAEPLSYIEVRYLEGKRFALDILQVIPELNHLMDPEFYSLDDWGNSGDEMTFMQELQRTSARLVGTDVDTQLLPRIFSHLEVLARECENISPPEPYNRWSHDPSHARYDVLWFMLFEFTDNPTLKDPLIEKLRPFMGPKILKMAF